MMMPVIDEQIRCDTQAAQYARRLIDGVGDSLSEKEFQNLSLMISELVTNSVQHGGLLSEDLIGLRIYLSVALIRSEVRNAGSGFELGEGSLIGGGLLENVPRIDQISGWGLQLVAGLADRWGVYSEPSRVGEGEEVQKGMTKGMTVVWVELDRDIEEGTAQGQSSDDPVDGNHH